MHLLYVLYKLITINQPQTANISIQNENNNLRTGQNEAQDLKMYV